MHVRVLPLIPKVAGKGEKPEAIKEVRKEDPKAARLRAKAASASRYVQPVVRQGTERNAAG